jgi:hypothetical protein
MSTYHNGIHAPSIRLPFFMLKDNNNNIRETLVTSISNALQAP